MILIKSLAHSEGIGQYYYRQLFLIYPSEKIVVALKVFTLQQRPKALVQRPRG